MSDNDASLLPPNATGLERALERLFSRHIRAIPQPHRSLWSAQDCPAPLLPWLALALGVDSWREDWPEQAKRNIVANALVTRKYTGTAAAVHNVVRQFGGNLSITEWWQKTPKGTPHTFDLTIVVSSSSTSSSSYFEQVIAEVKKVKPLRSKMTAIQGIYAKGGIKPAAVGRTALYTRLQLNLTTP